MSVVNMNMQGQTLVKPA